MNVAFIGLGAMGMPMARRLLDRGIKLTVHNRTRQREEPLAELGAKPAETPAAAASGNEIVITMVSDTPAVEEVVFGQDGVTSGAPQGAVIVDMSTIDPDAAASMAKRAEELGMSMLDAPVSGGTEGAASGKLSIMVGGDEAAFRRAQPVFSALGTTITHAGEAGMGQVTKAVNQVVVGGTFLAVAEGISLAIAKGLDPSKLIAAISAGAAGSWALANRAPRMIEGSFPLGFKMQLHRKDLRIALRLSDELGLPAPLSRLLAELEDDLIAAGFGDEDLAAVIRKVRAESND